MPRLLPVLICALFTVACSKVADRSASGTVGTPQLFAKQEAGFADAELAATKVDHGSDRSVVIFAAARTDAEDVGFRIVLAPKWDAWKPEGFPSTLFRGVVKIESVGAPTEAFVRALGKAYGQKVETYEFSHVSLTAISLEGDPSQVRTNPVKLKVFYESQKEDEYAEAFLNLDLPRGMVQFHEKDPGYRKAVIAYLSRKNG